MSSHLPIDRDALILELQEKIQGICQSALGELKAAFISKEFAHRLGDLAKQAINDLDTDFANRCRYALRGDIPDLRQQLTERLTQRLRPSLRAHDRRCHATYLEAIQSGCITVLKAAIATHGDSERQALLATIGDVNVRLSEALFSEATRAGQSVSPFFLLRHFLPGAIGFILRYRFLTKIKQRLAEQWVPYVGGTSSCSLLATLWRDAIEPERKQDFSRVWHGAPNDHGKSAGGIKETIEQFFTLRDTRSFTPNPPPWLAQSLGRRHAPLYQDILDYWHQIPRVPEQALVIAVAGPTSAGKSTLLNRLLGYSILKECFAAHTTPCPILVKVGRSRTAGRLRAYRKGRQSAAMSVAMTIPSGSAGPATRGTTRPDRDAVFTDPTRHYLEARESFWDPVRLEADKKRLQRIEIALPSIEWLSGQTILVDLPGVEGYYDDPRHPLARELTDLSRIWLARADVAVFVFAPEQVKRAGGCRFLSEYAATGRPFAVFISKCDLFSLDEWNTSDPDEARTRFAEHDLKPFFERHGIDRVSPKNLFLGAARLRDDAWGKRERVLQMQRSAVEDTWRLADWLRAWDHEAIEEHRLARQQAADRETASQISRLFAEHAATLAGCETPSATDPLEDPAGAGGQLTPAMRDRLLKIKRKLLNQTFFVTGF